MIDIDLIRKHISTVKQSETNRFRDASKVDEISNLDTNWKKMFYDLDQTNRKMNILQNDIKKMMKEKKSNNKNKDDNKNVGDNKNKGDNKNVGDNKNKGDDKNIGDNKNKGDNKNNGDNKNEDDNKGECNGLCEDISKLNINDNDKNISKIPMKENTHTVNNMTVVAKDPLEYLQSEQAILKAQKKQLTLDITSTEQTINTLLKSIANILDPAVHISNNEDDNKLIRTYRSSRRSHSNDNSKILGYAEIFEKIQGCDTARGSATAGHRGYFLIEDLALLGMSLARYAIDFMRTKGFSLVQTPVFMTRSLMEKTAQLSDFDDQLYKLEDDLYLIATSEQPLTTFHMDECMFDLPKKYVGHSLCFRKEAGAHGKDNQGIFRVHQFEKIEQFIVCEPTKSSGMFDEMVRNVEELYKSLDISYNIVSIVSGALNDAASIKYDIECYFPETDRYRELVSCSNCTDYQARDLNVRFGYGKIENEKVYVHMLNCTVVAVQRMLCCVAENYQEEDGMRIPEVLVKYMGKDKILYKK